MARIRKYRAWFEFCNTENEAIEKCKIFDSQLSAYARKTYPAHYTPWRSQDGTENLFIVWTVR